MNRWKLEASNKNCLRTPFWFWRITSLTSFQKKKVNLFWRPESFCPLMSLKFLRHTKRIILEIEVFVVLYWIPQQLKSFDNKDSKLRKNPSFQTKTNHMLCWFENSNISIDTFPIWNLFGFNKELKGSTSLNRQFLKIHIVLIKITKIL